jgi:uncharacterized protein (UPF0264 family)
MQPKASGNVERVGMQLLISVTSGAEAQDALRGGAQIIDIKNPAEGALGTASVFALHDVIALLRTDRPISAALGDSTVPVGTLALAAYGAAGLGAHFLKVGLLTACIDDAIILLKEVQRSARLANPGCRLVGVGYGDADLVGALSWRSLPEIAQEAQLWGCMIDTAIKDGRTLFDHCCEQDLENWLADCRRAGLRGALAGSLGIGDASAIRRLDPDIVGFRGAACRGDRSNGQVDKALVAALRDELIS